VIQDKEAAFKAKDRHKRQRERCVLACLAGNKQNTAKTLWTTAFSR
jgi:hypothetical protein